MNVARRNMNEEQWGQFTIDLAEGVTMDPERASAR